MTADVPDHRPDGPPAGPAEAAPPANPGHGAPAPPAIARPPANPGPPGGPDADRRPPGAVRLATVIGVPVYLHTSYLFFAIVVIVGYGPLANRLMPGYPAGTGYLLAGGFVLCLLVSVLLHELGHALVARRFGIGVRAITLELLGGYTEMVGDSPTPKADALVSLVGPAVSGVIGVAGLAGEWLAPDGTILEQLAFQVAWSNLIVAAFNILPGLPLDGGRALRALVWAVTGDRHTGTAVAGWVGRSVAAVTIVVVGLLFSVGWLSPFSVMLAGFVGLVVWRGATAAIRQARLAARVPTVDLRRLVRPVVSVVHGTPLAEAIRRRGESGLPDAALAVADGTGRLVALVHDRAAEDVPRERRPWVPVESVARTLEPGRTLAVTLAGEDVVAAVQAHPAPNYLVVSGDEVVGVLRTADLVRMLSA